MKNRISISSGVEVAATAELLGYTDLSMESWFLNQYFPGIPVPLSKSITALKWQDQVAESIRVNMDSGIDLVKLTKGLSNYTTVEDISGQMREIERLARAAIGGDTSEFADFQRLLRRSRSDIAGMIESNAPSKLGKAYEKVINAAENLNEKALDKAIENAIDKKALSNAFRIATTEINRAANLGEYTRALDDEDCVAMKWVLSAAGNNCDDCIDLAETDNGAGPGVWPMDNVPDYPHPRCRCQLFPVYKLPEGTDPDFSVDAEDYDGEFMERLPEDVDVE